MGAAWCRDRAGQAHDSKSPLDRVIVKCVNQMSLKERPVAVPVAQQMQLQLQGPAKYPRLHINKDTSASEWHDVALKVPDSPEEGGKGVAPVPPPRKKRQSVASPAPVPAPAPAPVETPKKAPPAPAIYLEVDTPVSQHRVKSSPILYKEDDLLRLPPRTKSSMSLRSASPVSEATTERLDNYLKSCRSFGSLRPEELIDEIHQALSDSSEDSWGGLDDWDLGFVEHLDTTPGSPLTPTSQLDVHNSPTRGHNRAEFVVGEPKPERKKKRTKSSKESVKRRLRKPEGKGGEDVLAPPANFQTDPKSHIHSNKGGSSLIKPSQISVQDFLRRSNDKTKTSTGLPELRLDVPTDNASFSFDFSKGLMPPRSPQIEIPGTPNTPRGLSRCSSPLPSMFNARTPTSSPTHDEEATSNLMRILQEYHCTADMIGDRDAKKILEELGIPENLLAEVPEIHKPQDNGGSGVSSMTPSLTELEASLSELLEASAVNNDDDEFEEELQHQTPRKLEEVNDVKPKEDASLEVAVPKIVSSKPEVITITERKSTTSGEDLTPRKTEEEVKEVTPKKDTPHEVGVPKIVPSQPEEMPHSDHKSSTKSDEDLTSKKVEDVKEATPKKDTPLDVVIAQQVPKIVSSQPEDSEHTETDLGKDGDLSKLTPAVQEAKRSSVITLLNVA